MVGDPDRMFRRHSLRGGLSPKTCLGPDQRIYLTSRKALTLSTTLTSVAIFLYLVSGRRTQTIELFNLQHTHPGEQEMGGEHRFQMIAVKWRSQFPSPDRDGLHQARHDNGRPMTRNLPHSLHVALFPRTTSNLDYGSQIPTT